MVLGPKCLPLSGDEWFAEPSSSIMNRSLAEPVEAFLECFAGTP
jgi:hypothetical protein